MKCPYCGYSESKVIDSRAPRTKTAASAAGGSAFPAASDFTTYETVESLPMVVVKKDGSRQSFDRRKVLGGMIRACEKAAGALGGAGKDRRGDRAGSTELHGAGDQHRGHRRKSDGAAAKRGPGGLCPVASVYRQFKDIDTFMTELNKLLADNR